MLFQPRNGPFTQDAVCAALRYKTHSSQWLAPRKDVLLLRRPKRKRSGAHHWRAHAHAAVKVQNSSTFAAALCDDYQRGQ